MNCADFAQKDLDKKLKEALECLLDNDSYLLKKDLNERSISHRLAMYLQQMFDGWDVDCEYNKDHDVTKKLVNFPKQIPSDDTNAKTVYPDIIIHHRGTTDNLLVIEMKKTTNNDRHDNDKQKLNAFKEEGLRYCHAVALKLRTGCEDYGIEELVFI